MNATSSFKHHDECGYPLFYVSPLACDVQCADCLNADIAADLVNIDECEPMVHWEGPEYNCCDCGGSIGSAYGDPEDEEE